ncbi:2612_t:CDS:2 [Funneliformis geosporum]|nr:2612_t:CDS:2 [Funneliformis geosporum]
MDGDDEHDAWPKPIRPGLMYGRNQMRLNLTDLRRWCPERELIGTFEVSLGMTKQGFCVSISYDRNS